MITDTCVILTANITIRMKMYNMQLCMSLYLMLDDALLISIKYGTVQKGNNDPLSSPFLSQRETAKKWNLTLSHEIDSYQWQFIVTRDTNYSERFFCILGV